MAGHSKWANIKHRKGREDAKRGKVFSKIAKEITVAARIGGGDPDANPRLRAAMDKGRTVNMPKDNINRAIAKGTGETGGANYETIYYEGYGPNGVAIYLEVLTDNKNRVVGEIRHAFSKCNGNLGESGCVGWLFDAKGFILVAKDQIEEEKIMELAIEAGAEDVQDSGEQWEITTAQADFAMVRDALEAEGLTLDTAEITMIPQTTTPIEGKTVEQVMRLMEMLEDNDDVQNVYANFDIDEEELAKLG